MTGDIFFYCESCNRAQAVLIEPLARDDNNSIAWGDIVCSVCHFVIATISGDQPGQYVFKRADNLP